MCGKSGEEIQRKDGCVLMTRNLKETWSIKDLKLCMRVLPGQ